MKKQKGYTDIGAVAALIHIIIWLLLVGSWIVNLLKLIDCDFEPSFKEEVIHGIGLVPIASVFTVWYDPEEKVNDNPTN